ncbi:class I SAM-dependent methyltransferase [SAR86 cluster bacterium]|nr:class I SAM-dependent methyltransferase [SAR86 cluster bacterium]
MINFLRGFGNAIMYRMVKIMFRLQLFMQMKVGLLNTYAPNAFMPRKDVLDDERASYARLDAINGFLPKNQALSLIDVGCNLGFFTFNLAKRGGFCIGIDYGRNEILAAKALAHKHSVDNIVFTQMEITPENASHLPKADIVICLSIFHHWIRKLGEQKSLKIMRGLADSSNKYLVFDTGQPNEKGVDWNQKLEFMNPNIADWADNYFKNLGFSRVVNLGEYRTSLSEIPRTLFIAIKD